MPNYFTDNSDLIFQFTQLSLERITNVLENNYLSLSNNNEWAPTDYLEAHQYYKTALQLVGQLSADFFSIRAASVDNEGCQLRNSHVHYAKGTSESINALINAKLMGILLPRRWGGSNMPVCIYTMMIEMIAQADASLMTFFGYQDIGEAIERFATQEQCLKYLPHYAQGKILGAMVLTEPHAGSDLQNIQLKAYQDKTGQWRLKGRKQFISNGGAELLLVLARTESTNKLFGLSLFICDGSSAHVHVERIESKMGLNGSPTCELFFDDAPAELLGKQRFGLAHVFHSLNHARFSVAAQALGIAEAAYKEAFSWSKTRFAFGEAIIKKPAIADLLIDMRVIIEGCRSYLYKTIQHVDIKNILDKQIQSIQKKSNKTDKEQKKYRSLTKEYNQVSRLLEMQSALVKYYLSEASNQVCFNALQVHGGTGYIKSSKIERLSRDVRITTIYEGTSQIQILSGIKGVKHDLLAPYFSLFFQSDYPSELQGSLQIIKQLRGLYQTLIQTLYGEHNKKNNHGHDKALVDLYIETYISALILKEACLNKRKMNILNRFVKNAWAKSKCFYEHVILNTYNDLEDTLIICDVYE
jgi:alkylation response protein AidB-like acyl-CoA dehydrogenase